MVFRVIPNRYVKCQIDFVKSLFKTNKPSFIPITNQNRVNKCISLDQFIPTEFKDFLHLVNFIQRNSTVLTKYVSDCSYTTIGLINGLFF